MTRFVDVCRFTPTAGSTTDWTFSAAVTGYQSPALAGVVNAGVYRYHAESADLTQWEIGVGAYNTGTGVLARSEVLSNSSGTGLAPGQSGAGTKINFSTIPQVALVMLAGDIIAIAAPQGRLTLTSGVPVMTSSVSGATSVIYTPDRGNMAPILGPNTFSMLPFAEMSQATTDTTKSPAAVAASKVYDMFLWNDAGTLRCTRGPAWTNDTTRGYTLTATSGIWYNTSAITNGPGAALGTWVGCIRSNASSTIDYIFGGAASGGTAAFFGVANYYNQRSTGTQVTDSGASYTYTPSTVRQARASAGNQISFLQASAENAISFSYTQRVDTALVAGAGGAWGVGFDSTAAYGQQRNNVTTNAASIILGASSNAGIWNPGLGFHVLSANESSDGSNANTFNAANFAALSAIIIN